MAVSSPQPGRWSAWRSLPLGLEGGHGGGDDVGHEIELGPAAPLRRVDSELGRWQGEGQPATAGVHRPGPQHLGQGRPGRVGVVAVEDGVGAVDYGGSFLWPYLP